MYEPKISSYFESRKPSAVRLAHLEFAKRTDKIEAINVAIGNVSLPMYPQLIKRMRRLNSKESPFRKGVVKYTPTIGIDETRKAFLNIIASSGFATEGLNIQITDGGSAAMELAILAVGGESGSNNNPILLIDPAYTNYPALANRTGRKTVSFNRMLQENGTFTLPDITIVEQMIIQHHPGALVVIPYDNPTGHFCDQQTLINLGKMCVKYNLWMISDEAYRELCFTEKPASSIWGLTEQNVPGILGRRISIESASKVWNACGLRVGALVTDNRLLHEKSVAEYTANLCAPALDQYIFGALAQESKENLQIWYTKQKRYYQRIMKQVAHGLKKELPELIVSKPEAAMYSVVDVRKIDPKFDSEDFSLYCSKEGRVNVEGKELTLLITPMADFYHPLNEEKNPGKTQMRLAYVATPDEMRLVPRLFTELLKKYWERKGKNIE